MARYSGFGKHLFEKLDSHFPGILSNFRFFQPQGSQQGDVWAYYEDDPVQFSVQLEPSGEVILLWDDNAENSIEIGPWWSSEYEAAIAFIEEVFFGKAPGGKFSFD
ncbi:hypothetical protein GCM10023185_17130 [Hymenobacter saemangeumensis]|uniref:SMI1/KNR4 family protein n=1 Tax=Hymenobacter saemangeumensis TaxID=1084522 RepID=A0ABP8IAR4_9BACT